MESILGGEANLAYAYENIRIKPGDEGIFTVEVHRPEVLNALNDATIRELDECFCKLATDSDARLIVVTGAGPKAFVAGTDIAELSTQSPLEARKRSRAGQQAFDCIEQLGKPVIAAINGFALGGGCELALACHLRYASEKAKLGLPEVGLGIIPGYGGTQRLARVVGQSRALEWILTGEMMTAEEAYRIGLLNGVFAATELLPRVQEIATKILSRGPVAIRFALDAVLRGGAVPWPHGQAMEADLFGVISATDDMREGMQAFLEKRTAHFQGK